MLILFLLMLSHNKTCHKHISKVCSISNKTLLFLSFSNFNLAILNGERIMFSGAIGKLIIS